MMKKVYMITPQFLYIDTKTLVGKVTSMHTPEAMQGDEKFRATELKASTHDTFQNQKTLMKELFK